MVFVDLIVILLLVFVSGIRDTIKTYQKMTLFVNSYFQIDSIARRKVTGVSGFIPFNLVVFFLHLLASMIANGIYLRGLTV